MESLFNLEFVIRLLIALVLGFSLGLERELTNKYAGLRTHILVALGACIFTIISIYGFPTFASGDNVNLTQATGITVNLYNDSTEYKATVVGTDSYTDLAVLRMDAKDVLGVASIGKSSNVKVGNTVFTVGSPMGSNYSGTVTKGILSGKDRLIETSSSTDSYTNNPFFSSLVISLNVLTLYKSPSYSKSESLVFVSKR